MANGWFWASDYSWGDIPFHYGRWMRNPQYSWLWVPGYIWGPAWVCWRHGETDGFVGWAPLPPGSEWADGGWRFNDHAVFDPNFEFGLGEDSYVFVANGHFRDEGFFRMRGRPNVFDVHRDQVHLFYARTIVRNEFHADERGRLVNEGLGHDRVEHLTQQKIARAEFEERRPVIRTPEPVRPAAQNFHPPQATVNKVYRPPVAVGYKPAVRPQGVPPPPRVPVKSAAPPPHSVQPRSIPPH